MRGLTLVEHQRDAHGGRGAHPPALKILSGLLYPTKGEVTVGGHVPHDRDFEFLRMITLVMGQKQQRLWDLPPVDTFAMNRALFDLPRSEAEATQKELVAFLEIGPLIGKPTHRALRALAHLGFPGQHRHPGLRLSPAGPDAVAGGSFALAHKPPVPPRAAQQGWATLALQTRG